MKQTKAEVLAKKITALEKVTTHLYHEIMNLKDLSIGTHELCKRMPGYDDAIKELQSIEEKEFKEQVLRETNNEQAG